MSNITMIAPRLDRNAKKVIFPQYLYETVHNWVNSTQDAVEQMGVLYAHKTGHGYLVFLAKHKATGNPNPVSLPSNELEKIVNALQLVNINQDNECQAILMHSHPSAYETLTEGDAHSILRIAKYAAKGSTKLDKHIIWPHNKKPRAYELKKDAIVEIPLQARLISEDQINSDLTISCRKAQLQIAG